MVNYLIPQTSTDFDQILSLQQANLPEAITLKEKQSEGFVTVKHTKEILEKMNAIAGHIIAKNEEEVIGYALSMNKAFSTEIPILIPMFEMIDSLFYNGQSLSEVDYLIMGQVCIKKGYRGQGIFKQLYQGLKQNHQHRFPLIITEVDQENQRSLRAHQKAGFKHLHSYKTSGGTKWEIIFWDWQ